MSASPRDLEQLRTLIALAVHEATPPHEAAAAALQAVRRIHRLDLLGLDALHTLRQDAAVERVNAETDARHAAAAEAHARASQAFTRIDVTLLIMSETSLAYRFARLSPDFRTKGMPCVGWVRKKYISQTVWASPEVAKRYSSAGRRVTEALVVPQEVAGAVRDIVFGVAR
jgi:hypothetical protein